MQQVAEVLAIKSCMEEIGFKDERCIRLANNFNINYCHTYRVNRVLLYY